MKIAGIAPYKGKVLEISFENDDRKIYLHEDIVHSQGLRKGTELAGSDIARLRSLAAEHRAYEYALYLLDRRMYSYKELCDKLLDAKNSDEAAVFRALERLTAAGLVNDERCAEELARHYLEVKRFGPWRAKMEMRQKGLSDEDIDNAIAPYEENGVIRQSLDALLRGKYSALLKDPGDRAAVEKAKRSLAARGFGYEEIRDALEDYFDESAQP